MEAIYTKEFKQSGFDIKIQARRYYDENENTVFGIWEHVNNHKGGVTIQYPNAGRNGYRWWINTQYSLAELTKDYTKQGRENPSYEAYESLQRELCVALESYLLSVVFTVSKAGYVLEETNLDTFYANCQKETEEDIVYELIQQIDVEELIKDAKENIDSTVKGLKEDILTLTNEE